MGFTLTGSVIYTMLIQTYDNVNIVLVLILSQYQTLIAVLDIPFM
jgi:hypothetical protein